MADTIREYESDPEYRGSNVADATSPTGWRADMVWVGKRAVDLMWVASARPSYITGATEITLAGSGSQHAFTVKVKYEDFMRDWMASRQPPLPSALYEASFRHA